MRSVMCAVAVLIAVPVFACEMPPSVRPLAVKGVNFDYEKGGNTPKPVEIKSAEELAKSPLFADAAGRDAIKKQVNFATEKLVVFVWKGSGQDKFSGQLVKRGGTALFTYEVGKTDDLRHYADVFAVQKHVKVEME